MVLISSKVIIQPQIQYQNSQPRTSYMQSTLSSFSPSPILYLVGLVRGGHSAEPPSCLPLGAVWDQLSPWDRERRYTYHWETSVTLSPLESGGCCIEQSVLVLCYQILTTQWPIVHRCYCTLGRHALTTLVKWLLSWEQNSLGLKLSAVLIDFLTEANVHRCAWYRTTLLHMNSCRMCCHGNQCPLSGGLPAQWLITHKQL